MAQFKGLYQRPLNPQSQQVVQVQHVDSVLQMRHDESPAAACNAPSYSCASCHAATNSYVMVIVFVLVCRLVEVQGSNLASVALASTREPQAQSGSLSTTVAQVPTIFGAF